MARDYKTGVCAICGFVGRLTEHHRVWPRKSHPGRAYRDEFITLVCRPCHDLIHDVLKLECKFSVSRYHQILRRHGPEGGDSDGPEEAEAI